MVKEILKTGVDCNVTLHGRNSLYCAMHVEQSWKTIVGHEAQAVFVNGTYFRQPPKCREIGFQGCSGYLGQ